MFILFYFERNKSFPGFIGHVSTALMGFTAPAAGKHTRQQRALETKKCIADKGNMGALERIHLSRVIQWKSRVCVIYRETD